MSSTSSPGAPSRAGRRSPLVVLLIAFVTASLVAGVLIAGLVLPAAGAAGLLARDGVNMFNSLDSQLEDMPLPEGSTMYASDGKTVLARFYEENRVVTPLTRIAPVMQQAIIAIEDARFFEHGGVDPKGLVRAAVSNEINDGTVQGASTLTQQYVKNVLLESAVVAGDKRAQQAATVKTSARKLKEIRMAIQYEKDHSKEEILEGYLNIANFGQNNYGVEAASRYFFKTSAAKLTLPQAALLAGLVQIPETYNPFKYPEAATERRRQVLSRMYELGMITKEQFAEADASALPTEPQRALSGCVTAKEFAYFCDYAIKMLISDPRYEVLGENEQDRLNVIKRGGLKIVTTVDAKLQTAATGYLMKRIPADDSSNVAAAAVTMEPGTGRVLTIAQNRFFSPDKGDGLTEVSYGVDGKYGAGLGFQPGSNFKPFTLATWLVKNKGLRTSVNGSITKRPFSDFTSCGKRLGGQTYEYFNSETSDKPASIDVMSATYRSVNTAYVDMESRLDLCDIAKTSEAMGVHLASVPFDTSCQPGGEPSTKVPTECPSLTLGSFNVSPMTMANAYAVFAAEGKYCPPTPIDSLTDRTGKAMTVGKTECNDNALPVDVARAVTYTMKNVFTRGTATNIGRPPWPAAGKTGTTDASLHTWFTGYTKQRATSVVVTDPTVYKRGTLNSPGQKSLNGRRIGGNYYGRVYGATIAAPLWRQIMGAAMDGQGREDWKGPSQAVINGSGIPVANVTGRSINSATSILSRQGFRVRVSSPVPAAVGTGQVARTSPPPGGRLERGSTVYLYPGDGSLASPSDPDNGGGGVGDGGGDGAGGGNGGGGNGNGRGIGNGRGGGGGGDAAPGTFVGQRLQQLSPG